MTTSAVALSELEYLTNPDYEHCEYVAGEAVSIPMGTKEHSRTQARLAQKLNDYLDRNPIGYAATELHCRLNIGGEPRYRLPDVSLVLQTAEDRGERYLEGAPHLAVEILSPEDTISAQVRKANEYLANGSRMVWLVVPDEGSVLILTPDAPPRSVLPGETLEAGDVLPGLQFPVDSLFPPKPSAPTSE